MQVKYPLTQLYTLEFLMAVVDLVYGCFLSPERELHSAREIATIKELVWG
jgi:hypothetical protein